MKSPTALTPKNQFIKDLRDKEPIAAPFLIKFSALGVGKNGKSYMNLVLMDRTGEIEARIWDDVTQFAGVAVVDSFVWVDGRCQVYQNRRQVVVKSLRLLREDEVETKDFICESGLDVEALYLKIKDLIGSMQDPFYKALCEGVFVENADVVDRMKRAPAAKSVHHAYRGGLIEHMVSIAEILDKLAAHYTPHVDRDLLLVGGFFHDIGKLWELSYERTTDYTMEGRLIGHLVMGVELIERTILALENQSGRIPENKFPEEKKLLAKHMVLAHHGQLEYGSPKRPKCLEALIVHAIDDLDSKVNSIRVFIEQDQTPGRWTALHRHHERYFFKPDWAQKPEL